MPERGDVKKAVAAPTIPAADPRVRRSATAANDVIEIPLHGRIAAGTPIEALEGATMLPVPAALLGAGEHYALEVAGDSMVEAGILDGDYALIRRTETARDGEIVVALIDDARGDAQIFPQGRRDDPPRSRQSRLQLPSATAPIRCACRAS
jgi:repressor LexA